MADAKQVTPIKMELTSTMKTVYAVMIFLGLAAFVVTLINNQERAWHAYLVGFFYVTTLAVGGLFFTAIHHMVRAGWSVNVRRYCEAFTSFLPVAFVAGLLFVFGGSYLWDWMVPEIVEKDALIQHKAAYLNNTFFWIRLVGFFLIWLLFTKIMVGGSLKQDQDGSERHSNRNVVASVIFMLIFALSYSFFSVDTLMSLDAHWFSTIFGVYTFAGLFQSVIAMMILFIIHMMKKGQLKGIVDDNHLHDLGKFLFAFTIFWAYIAYSQYMLIWYANLPEETIFYIPRSQGSWAVVSLILIFGKFIIPFFALLSRRAKRHNPTLVVVSVWILLMQYVDIYWLVYPNLNEEQVVFSLPEILIFLGFLGAFLFTTSRFLSQNSVVPVKDPYLDESLHHHFVY